MPKKCKRRTAAAGTTDKEGAGGHENIRAGAGTEQGDDGILTAGALRMLTNKAVSEELTPGEYAVQTFREDGPRLQFVELSTVQGPKNCLLSDGEHHILGGVAPALLLMVRSKACVRYSIIEVTRCFMIKTKSKEFVLLLDGFNLVDRNFGRKVGARNLPLLSLPLIRPAGQVDAPHGVCANVLEGILTAGVIEHIVTRASAVAETSASNFNCVFDRCTPRLQVLGIDSSYSSSGPRTTLSLSDGVHVVAGSLCNPSLEGMFRSKAIVVNSIISVQQCGANTTPGARPFMLLVEIKVIDRNFGRIIGNPVTFPILDLMNQKASITPDADQAVPYSNRLEFVRRILLQHADSVNSSTCTFKAEADQYLKVLKLPRVHTEGFRSIFIMEWFRIVDHALEMQAPYASDELDERFVTDEDLQNSIDLFALIACDDTEQRTVRALANLALAIPTKRKSTLKASHINYLRRFLADANDGIADELPPMIDVGTDHSYSPAAAFDGCIEMGRDFLIYREGPPRGENVSPLDRNGHPLNKDRATAPYYSSFGGGCCDYCGKTPTEVGLHHLFKCSRCRLSWYCSPSCQAQSWTQGHADHCKKIARFAKGDTVVLHGLKQREDLNGSRVQVEEPLSNGRFRVSLEGGCESTITMSGGKMTMHTKILPKKSLSVNKKNLRHQRPLK